MRRKSSAAILAIIFVGTWMWAQGPTEFHPGFNLFSKEQDVQLGKESADQVVARLRGKLAKEPGANLFLSVTAEATSAGVAV